MKTIGLTGSIAMGKTETAKLFRSLSVPVFDSDAEVHDIYSTDSGVIAKISQMVPQAVIDEKIDRQRLSRFIQETPGSLERLEEIVHPVVRQREQQFLARCRELGHNIVVLDIPLLFETGREKEFDAIVVASAPAELQRERALTRAGMTPKKLDFILSRQMPDAEKRAKASYVVDTSKGLDDARSQVVSLLARIRSGPERP